jgi:hypothetical protein
LNFPCFYAMVPAKPFIQGVYHEKETGTA